eukprot:gene6190-6661_t
MSGAGRKSYYRKGATQYFESDELELSSTDRIGKILSNRGANIFDIQVTASPDEAIMVKLPTKFHKVVWVKVKDYVVIEEFSSKEEIPLIKYVLNKDHIKYLKKEGRWPEFLEEGDSEDNKLKPNKSNIVNNYMSDILPDNYEEYEEEEEEYEEGNTEEGI